MNIASTKAASPVATSTDSNAPDPSTGGADSATPGGFGRVFSESLRQAADARDNARTGPATPGKRAGATRGADGGSVVTCPDPTLAVPDNGAAATPAAAIAAAADDRLDATAALALDATDDPLAAARAQATADAKAPVDVRADTTAATKDLAAVGAFLKPGVRTQPKIDAMPDAKSDAKTAQSTSDQADATATDLAAQIALVSQWAALAQQAAHPAGGATASGDARDVRSKRDGALKDAAAGVTGTSLALERATHGLMSPSGAATSDAAALVDAARGATSEGQAPTMEKLLALAGNALNGNRDTATMSNFAQEVAAQMAAGMAAVAPTTDVAQAVGQTAASALTVLHEQVGTPAWSHEIGQAALRMAADDMQNVSLRLHPEHLGPLDVQMRIDNGIAHLQFAAAHAETRQALEASRSTLDNLFGQQGMKLGEWSVGQQSAGNAFAQNFGAATGNGGGAGTRGGGADDNDGALVVNVPMRSQRALGLVDTFA